MKLPPSNPILPWTISTPTDGPISPGLPPLTVNLEAPIDPLAIGDPITLPDLNTDLNDPNSYSIAVFSGNHFPEVCSKIPPKGSYKPFCGRPGAELPCRANFSAWDLPLFQIYWPVYKDDKNDPVCQDEDTQLCCRVPRADHNCGSPRPWALT